MKDNFREIKVSPFLHYELKSSARKGQPERKDTGFYRCLIGKVSVSLDAGTFFIL